MAGKQGIWTEQKIERMEAAGFGKGQLSNYRPWIRVESVSSLGRSRRVWSSKTGRTHHLLSDVEHNLFLALEWQHDIVDIREQYPLDRALTQDIARCLNIRHPYYPTTHVPTVMTVDFLVTKVRCGTQEVIAFNAKRDEEAEDEKSINKLEIQRDYFSQLDITHHIVYHSDIPPSNVANIGDIREAPLRPDEAEPRVGFFADLCVRMAADLPTARPSTRLGQYCAEFDGRLGLPPGTGIRVARMLMAERVLIPDLSSPNLVAEPIAAFALGTNSENRHALGGL